MGRRVTSTTKGGRYMNPADQERKMARKKELKKNKKQRHMVRQAVLKSKDPEDLLVQMEKLDEMEFSDMDLKPLSDRVIQEKRNKLRETYIRVLAMYKRENEMDKFTPLKRELQAYDEKRTRLEQQFVAQKFAREVNPAEIPLPDSAPPPPEAAAAMTPAAALASRMLSGAQPFPSHLMIPGFAPFNVVLPGMDLSARPVDAAKAGAAAESLHSILKKSRKRSTVPPGPPVGLPPDMSDSSDDEGRVYGHKERSVGMAERRRDSETLSDEDEDTDDPMGRKQTADDKEDTATSRPPRVRFDDGADDQEKDSRTKYKEFAKMIERGEIPKSASISGEAHTTGIMPLLQTGRPGAAIPPPPSLSMVSPGVAGGPPRLRLPGPPAVAALGQIRPGVRMPPPPPGFPQSRAQRPPAFVGHVPGVTSSVAAVLSAPPSLNNPKQGGSGAVIEAKPQLRNMQQEITKLVPTAVKLRREQHAAPVPMQKKPKGPLIFRTPEAKISVPGSSVQHTQQKSTDEAYDEFMKEMQMIT